MAWTVPATATVGQLVTASWLNTYLRDNMNALHDFLTGSADLGSNWKLSSGRSLLFHDADVAHGMTTVQATDVYGALASISGTAGGVQLTGLSDTDAAALLLVGYGGSATPTVAPVQITAVKKNGTGAQAIAAGEVGISFAMGGAATNKFYGDGGLNIVTGGLSVGYAGVPVAGTLAVGDANLRLELISGIAGLNFSSTAYISYDRSASAFRVVSGSKSLRWDDNGLRPNGAGFLCFPGGGSPGVASPEGVINFGERSDPTAPSANEAYLYAKDNGAGKTGLYILFPTGTSIQIAVQA